MSSLSMCLNMIVKDESHIIERTLHMLCSKIRFDYWVICDTGSTDNTREIIVQFFKEKNIPGELHCDEWVDFGHNRSLALERAFNKTDLLLVFDADDEIHGTLPIPNEILFDEYQLAFGSPKSGMNYTRTQIINNHKRFKYLSVLHEYISCQEPEPARVCILNGDYYLVSGRSGSRNKDPNKYLKDAIILEKAHAVALAKGDDLHKRYAFYCANSYRDCGRHEDAIKWYKITLSQDNWEQEKYVSCLYIHQCYEALKQSEHGFFYLVKAFSYDSSRVECLYPLVVHYCCENMSEMAYNYFRLVKMTTPQNNAGKLFVETDKAGFYVPYYMIIVADRMKDYECGIRMYEHIFKEKHRTFSPWHLRNLIFNLRFFISHVKPDALNAFVELANSYFKFVIDNGVPANTFQDLSINLTSTGTIETTMTNKIKAKNSFKTSQNILVYTGYCNVHWNYTKMKHGALGGSEKAVAHLTKELGIMLGREKGTKIYVAGDVQPENLAEEFNVVYVSLNELPELLSKLHFHTVVCSRYISFLELYGNACSFYQFYIWAHDTCLLSYGCNLSDTAIIEKWADCIDGCVCQTQWHAERYIELYPSLKTKMQTINNGIDLELFPPSVSKEAGKFVYTSRTERGLARVLELWPEVVAAVPNAALTVSTYEAFPCNDEERRIQCRIESLNQEFPNNRIQHAGKLNPTELYAQLSTAEYWLYPTNWPETSCITAMEMLMSGVICLYYPLAGLKDTMNGHGLQIAPGSEIKTLREIAHDETRKDMLRKQGRAYAESCSWAIRANSWKQIIFQKRIAIFNSFPFHYEMFGHILDHFSRHNDASTVVSIFTETRNELGWLEFYKTHFKNLNLKFKPVAEFCDARNAFDLIFVPTDDDFAFKREWIDERCIANDHHVSIRRPEYAHRIGVRPFAGSDKQWALPCCEFVSANEKLGHLETDCIHVAIGGGLQCILNYDAINRLSASVPLHVHFIGRKIIEVRSKIKEDIVIHLHEKMDTSEMIELLKKCDYIMTDLQNDDHINGISMSGSVPLAFSTLTSLIISKQNNRIYGFKNVVEFELNADADDRIVLSKRDDNDIERLKVERDGLIAMYDGAIKDIVEENAVQTTVYKVNDELAFAIDVRTKSLHSTMKLKYGSFNDEYPEQKIAVRHLSGNEKVLEIGGNIGRNSLIISSLLQDQANLVVMECDDGIAEQLTENRDLNGHQFHIERSALSKRRLIQRGWDTVPSDVLVDGFKWVNTLTIDELKNKYNIAFDTLVLDCEGAFYYILMDMPEILDGIKLILMENDYHELPKKMEVNRVLREHKFKRIYAEGGGWGPCEAFFFEAWSRDTAAPTAAFPASQKALESQPKKIIDCFMFYNELEMLAYRLHALHSVVDYFVIVEARQTFIGASKPLYFDENKHDARFLPYSDKIIHIVIDLPHTQGAMNMDISKNHQWTNETFQRNCINRGIDELASRLNDHDIIIVADLDEVPDPATLAKMKERRFSLNKVVAFEQDLYYYNLKCKHNAKWYSCKALTFRTYMEMNSSFETIRHLRGETVAEGGWHMSYFGDAKFIKNKIENFSHQEHNLEHITDVDAIQKRIDDGIDLYMRPDETFEHIAICDNKYLPPFYETHLSAFF